MEIPLAGRLLTAALMVTFVSPVGAQTVPAGDAAAQEVAVAVAAAEQAVVASPETLAFANRPIVQLRAVILGRTPGDRAAAALQALDRLAEEGITGPVRARAVGPAMSIDLAGRRIIAIFPADVDALAGETPAAVAEAAARRLDTAVNEVAELRRPQQLLTAGLWVLLATAVFVALTWGLLRVRSAAGRRVRDATERKLHATKMGDAEFLKSSRVVDLIDRS